MEVNCTCMTSVLPFDGLDDEALLDTFASAPVYDPDPIRSMRERITATYWKYVDENKSMQEWDGYSAQQKKLLEGYDYSVNSSLYDILASGAWLGSVISSKKEFDEQVKADALFMIDQEPASLKFRGGWLRLHTLVTPLAIACLNSAVPKEIVEKMLEAGADPEEKIWNSPKMAPETIRHLMKRVDEEMPRRSQMILDLFAKFDRRKVASRMNKISEIYRAHQEDNAWMKQWTHPEGKSRLLEGYDYGTSSCLYDIVASGNCLEGVACSKQEFGKQAEADALFVINYDSSLLKFRGGVLVHYSCVTPLAVACLNATVPETVLQAMLKAGADPDEKIWRDGAGFAVTVRSVVALSEPYLPERVALIQRLFAEFDIGKQPHIILGQPRGFGAAKK